MLEDLDESFDDVGELYFSSPKPLAYGSVPYGLRKMHDYTIGS